MPNDDSTDFESFANLPEKRVAPPPQSADAQNEVCEYCAAALSPFFYFCLRCGTPYKSLETVITPSRPRELTDEERVRIQVPQVSTLFWAYFAVVFGVGVFSFVVFREDRPDLQLVLNEI